MLRRPPKNNPHGARKLRAQVTIVEKEKGPGNWPEVQMGVQASLSLGLRMAKDGGLRRRPLQLLALID
jgi:hypothetical protein